MAATKLIIGKTNSIIVHYIIMLITEFAMRSDQSSDSRAILIALLVSSLYIRTASRVANEVSGTSC